MKHRTANSIKTGRNFNQRKALRRGLAIEIILRERIRTTLAKAKMTRGFLEKLARLAQKNGEKAINQIMADLPNKIAVKKLIADMARKYQRTSGFTRILKLNPRQGDNAEMVMMEWVEPDAERSQVSNPPPSLKLRRAKQIKNPKLPLDKKTVKSIKQTKKHERKEDK